MKSSNLILALWLGAISWAQTSPQKPVNPPAAKPPVVAQPAAPNAQKVGARSGNTLSSPTHPRAAKPAATKPPARSITRSSSEVRRRRPASVGTSVAAAAKPRLTKGRRDPFVSPVVERFRDSAACTGTGRQCLLVGEISLRGVVRSPSGFIAVVVNGEHTYFLRENDPLADGAVERITKDAIVLREHSSDALGRSLTREVTKKLGAVPAV